VRGEQPAPPDAAAGCGLVNEVYAVASAAASAAKL